MTVKQSYNYVINYLQREAEELRGWIVADFGNCIIRYNNISEIKISSTNETHIILSIQTLGALGKSIHYEKQIEQPK